MSLTLTLYKFSKRQNSTAVPDSSSGTEVSIDLKDQTQILTPTFVLHWTEYPDFNYAEFMGRYYFISTIESIRNDIWSLSCSVDLLATYKSNILSTSAFVAYDTTANTEITDRRLSTKTTTVHAESVGTAGDMLGRGYCVAINTVGESGCATYIMDMEDAAGLLNTLEQTMKALFPASTDPTPPPMTTIEEIMTAVSDAIANGFRQIIGSANAADCIKSAFLIPIPASYISGTADTVKLGIYNTHKQGKKRTSRGIQTSMNVSIPWQTTDWRRNAPYTEVYLYIPFIGVVSYPASALIGATMFNILVALDETAGDAIFTVSIDVASGGIASKVIGQYSANIAASFPIGASNITPAALGTSILAAAGVAAASIATGGAAAVAAGTAGIVGELNSATPIPSSIGAAGGGALLALWGYAPRCLVVFHDTNVAPDSVSAVIGTPSNEVKSLGGLSGYVETRCASVSGDMLESERTQLNALLDGGIYIE